MNRRPHRVSLRSLRTRRWTIAALIAMGAWLLPLRVSLAGLTQADDWWWQWDPDLSSWSGFMPRSFASTSSGQETALTDPGATAPLPAAPLSTLTKANNTNNLNLTTSWTGGVVPGSGDIALWDSTVTAANSVSLGADLNFGEIQITNPGGNVTINGSFQTLTLSGVSGIGIDLSSATRSLTLNCNITLGAAQTWQLGSLAGFGFTVNGTVNNGGNLLTITNAGTGAIISGVISGAGGLTYRTTNSGLSLFQTNTYSGVTTIDGGTVSVSTLANINTASSIGTGSVAGSAADLVFGGGALAYSASGSTPISTNRLFTLGDANGLTATLISNSANSAATMSFTGTGAIAFGGTGARTVTLSGQNTGNNIFAPILGDGAGGATSLVKVSTGKWVLTGANTYSGGTSWGSTSSEGSGGILSLGLSSSGGPGSILSGPLGTGTLTVRNNGSAAINFIQSSDSTSRTISNAIVVAGSNIIFSLGGTGDLTFDGTVSLGSGTRTFDVAAITGTFSGVISGSGAITKTGSGTLKLSGNNNYSGGTTVSAGLLWLNSSTALGSSNGSLTVNGGIVDLSGNNISVGNLTGSGGTIWNNLGPSSAVTLTIGNNNNGGGNYQGVITDTNGASPGSTMALTKTGSGTITLSGTNTYTGATTVNGGGSLFINGNQSAATGAVTVNGSGTTLGGSGIIGGSVTISSGTTSNNNLSPGATGQGSVARLSTGALTLNTSTNLKIDITGAGGSANAGTTYDQVNVTGTVNLGGVLASSLVLNVSGLTEANVGEKFFIVLNDGTDLVSGTFAQGATVTAGGYTFAINYADNGDGGLVANDVSLTMTPVPEPATWVGAALALGAVAAASRRRRR